MYNLVAFFLLCTVLMVAWKAQHLRTQMIANVRRYCSHRDLILLDETVVIAKRYISWSRGWHALQREWHFEFTTTGHERYQGKAYSVGWHLTEVVLPPYRLATDSPAP